MYLFTYFYMLSGLGLNYQKDQGRLGKNLQTQSTAPADGGFILKYHRVSYVNVQSGRVSGDIGHQI